MTAKRKPETLERMLARLVREGLFATVEAGGRGGMRYSAAVTASYFDDMAFVWGRTAASALRKAEKEYRRRTR